MTFSAIDDIAVCFITYAFFFFFGKQLIEILLRNFKALHFFCSTYTPKFAVWNFEQQQLMALAIFCVQLLCYCST